jgi:hypothetical protein
MTAAPPIERTPEQTRRHVQAKYELATAYFAQGRLTRRELERCRRDRDANSDTGPIRFTPGFAPWERR